MLESIWLEKEYIVSAGHVKTEQFQYYLQRGRGSSFVLLPGVCKGRGVFRG